MPDFGYLRSYIIFHLVAVWEKPFGRYFTRISVLKENLLIPHGLPFDRIETKMAPSLLSRTSSEHNETSCPQHEKDKRSTSYRILFEVFPFCWSLRRPTSVMFLHLRRYSHLFSFNLIRMDQLIDYYIACKI